MATPGISTGPSSRPLTETMAETGPGLADDAVLPGELTPGELDEGADDDVERLKDAGWTDPDAAGSVGGS